MATRSDKKKSGEKKGNATAYSEFLQFLRSPMWQLPVMSFIEQRSLAFDKDQEDNKLYKQIHNEFKSMIDMLIQCFCEDANMKPQQIVDAITSSTKPIKTILEPVIAAQEFMVFVHMMMRKNIELQLQALQMIEIVYGLIPSVLLPGSMRDGAEGDGDDQEHLILIEVIRQSKEDYEKDRKRDSPIDDRIVKESLKEKDRLEDQKQKEEEMLKMALKLSLEDDSDGGRSQGRETSASRKKSATVREPSRHRESSAKRRSSTNGEEGSQRPRSAKDNLSRSMGSNSDSKINPAELAERQEYLRKQRDKLLNMKREAREKAFADAEKASGKSRPKTAKAAKNALKGRPMPAGMKADPDILAARRALAAKLKEEVVGDL